MTSQRVERTWICTGGYGRFRGEWVNDDTILLRYFYLDLYYHFYNNCTISRVLIGGQLCSIRVKKQTMETMWWWGCNFSLSRIHCFPRNFNRNGHQNCQCYCKNQTATVFHSLYSHWPIERLSWTQNVQNFAVKPLTHGSWFHLMFEHI